MPASDLTRADFHTEAEISCRNRHGRSFALIEQDQLPTGPPMAT
jgi:hypothetical protein